MCSMYVVAAGVGRVGVTCDVRNSKTFVTTGAVKEDYGQGAVEGVEAWVASKALAALQADAEAGQAAVKVRLDGRDVVLKVGRHLFWNAARQ